MDSTQTTGRSASRYRIVNTSEWPLDDLAGKDVARFADLLTETMEAAAAANNCEPEIEGREGWGRMIAKYGYRPHAVLFRKASR